MITNFTPNSMLSSEIQFENIKTKIWLYLRGCDHAMELQLSPRLKKLMGVYSKFGHRKLVDIDEEEYPALEKEIDQLIAETEVVNHDA